MRMHYKYILFDLDGTLTESAPGIINAVLYALKKNGIEETDRGKLMAFIGPPLYDSFQKYYGMTPEQADHMVDDYREYHQVRGWKENSVYEGIPEVLRTLREQGRKLVVATSKPEAISRRTVSYFQLDPYFEFVAGASMDSSRSRKGDVIAYALSRIREADAAKAGKDGDTKETAFEGTAEFDKEDLSDRESDDRILMVGDRFHDVDGAKENGLPCIGVLYGYGSQVELEQAGAAAICPEVRDLPRVIRELEENE
ncbi:MAG: HAD hydrolase-like protein [Lachnospiraceae bacterium]|nr:HAD hydrolase-like protein [Lachnospiraceae bacterium]